MLAGLLAAAAVSVMTFPAPAHAPSSPVVNAKSASILITTIAFGEIDPNGAVPTVNGVPDAGTTNWDIPLPTAVLTSGTNYTETFTFYDIDYTGSCAFLIEVTSDKTGEALLKTPVSNISCSPGATLVSTTTGAVSLPPGPVTARATVYYGKKRVSMKAPLTVQ